jgi:two-component system nitrate/nitrite response regulator NarL
MDVDQSPDTTPLNLHRHIGVLIVSRVRFLCESLAEVLARDGPGTVLGLCTDMAEALSLSGALKPNILLLDAGYPDGIDGVRRLRTAAPGIRVIAFAVAETEESVIAWAEAGIAGYVPSTAALSDLSAVLALVIDGAQACEARVAGGLLRRIAQAGAPKAEELLGPSLTVRERQIITMIGAGLSNKDIARRLNIGLGTTKSHVHNLLGKLNVRRRGEAAAWVREQTAKGFMLSAALSLISV